jgi:hypothetical protein
VRNQTNWGKELRDTHGSVSTIKQDPSTHLPSAPGKNLFTLKASHVKWQTSQTVHQTNYLIDQQLRRLEQDFIKDGGLRERMTRACLQARGSRNG